MKKIIYFVVFLFISDLIYADSFSTIIDLIKDKQYSEASDELSKIRSNLNKDEIYLYYYYKGKIYFQLKDFKSAAENFHHGIKLKPNRAFPYNDLGLAYLHLKKNKKAITYLLKAIKIDKSFAIAYYHLGNVYLKLKQNKKAIKSYKSAIQLEKDKLILSSIYLGLGNAYQGKNFISNSIESFTISIKNNKNNWKAYMNLGLVYFNQDLFNEAIESFKEVIKINENFYNAYFYLGNCYRGIKEYPEMEANYMLCLKHKPDFTDALYSLASYYALKNKKDFMLKYLKNLFSVDEQYKSIIINDKLFKKYNEDRDFIKLIKGGKSGCK